MHYIWFQRSACSNKYFVRKQTMGGLQSSSLGWILDTFFTRMNLLTMICYRRGEDSLVKSTLFIKNLVRKTIFYMKLVSIFFTNLYRSNLWDLFRDSAERLCASWNIMVRYCFDIPWKSHRYFIETISCTTHLKLKLIKRLNQFYESVIGQK